ncbi:staphylococcal nuclease domain-containing protein 1-like isoform X2 [Hylaeus volcanicus]|uniref:staphylococcal nuclease domain-containing protein 1-like isoform X2 n=1 Tax=Hylaeus volcanicus TaxID=313075 RepID=UPI0023B83F43|nr:staphylococcal nuclease domain-containing protein 1-like isoform X2 [Hylaeus volcanicus]
MKWLYGTVAQVLSGDTILLVGTPKMGPPPERLVTISLIVAPKVANKTKTYENPDQPFGYHSREFLRKLLIGKSVKYAIHGIINGKEYARILLDNDRDIGTIMVEAGMAKIGYFQKKTENPSDEQYYNSLVAAEEKAKENSRGLWTKDMNERLTAVRVINWLFLNPPNTKTFAEKYLHEILPAIVEVVRTSGSYRVYFPENTTYISLSLSGYNPNGFKINNNETGEQAIQWEPFGLEGKYFASQRILNHDLHVRIEGCDDFGNVYGTFIHPNGNLTSLLLRNGFGRVNERTVSLTENGSELREAQHSAQTNRLRIWQDFDFCQTSVAGKKEYFARVIEVISGDCILAADLHDFTLGITPGVRLYLASIRCPRLGNRNRDEEPWSFEAKEFVRRRLIGKRVKILVEYIKKITSTPGETRNFPIPSDNSNQMHFVSILLDNEKTNLSEQLVFKGLATVLPDYGDSIASNYDILKKKQEEAKEKKLGMYSTDKPAKRRVNDISGSSNAHIAKHFQGSFKRMGSVSGIIEYVMSATRYKIFIPSESVIITFLLAGVRAPIENKNDALKGITELGIAQESHQYAIHQYLQRPVEISIQSCGRGGAFVGLAWYAKEAIAVDLVRQGYSTIFGRVPSVIQNQLEEAQRAAMGQSLGVWSGDVDVEDILDCDNDSDTQNKSLLNKNLIPDYLRDPCLVSIIYASNINDFYVQKLDSKQVETFHSELAEYISRKQGGTRKISWAALQKGSVVLCQFSEDKQKKRK